MCSRGTNEDEEGCDASAAPAPAPVPAATTVGVGPGIPASASSPQKNHVYVLAIIVVVGGLALSGAAASTSAPAAVVAAFAPPPLRPLRPRHRSASTSLGRDRGGDRRRGRTPWPAATMRQFHPIGSGRGWVLRAATGGGGPPSEDPFDDLAQRGNSGADKDDEDDVEEGPVFYDDFGDGGGLIGDGEADVAPAASAGGPPDLNLRALTARVDEQRTESVRRDARLARNWGSGNWAVRGFALDASDAADDLNADPEESRRIHVSRIALDLESVATPDGAGEAEEDDRDAVLAVGRTDGSCVVVRLGGEYLTRFRSVPQLTFEEVEPADDEGVEGKTDDDDGGGGIVARVGSRLVRSDDIGGKNEDATSADDNVPYNAEDDGAPPTPFEILHQFRAIRDSDSDVADDVAVTSLLLDGRDLFASGGGESGRVEHWRLPNPDAGDDPKVEHVRTLAAGAGNDDAAAAAGGGGVVAIRALASLSSDGEERDLILTVERGGTFSLWDRQTGELINTIGVRDERNETVSGILSADVTVDDDEGGVGGGLGGKTLIFLGLDTGHVQGYALRDVLMGSSSEVVVVVPPACRFLAHGDAGAPGVTALAWAGAGTLDTAPRGSSPSSMPASNILLTGGADGVVKQWEIFARGAGGGGSPPPGTGTPLKLEHWPRLGTQRMKRRAHVLTGTRHDGGVSAVAGDAAKVLSCGADGRVVVWSPTTGEKMYVMDGFTGDISSLCVGRTLLVTDGMDRYVCLHDFDTAESLDDAYETGVD